MNYRQGDVLVVPADQVTGTPVARIGDRIILAEGEATGHAHAICDPEAELLHDPKTEARFLRVLSDAGVDLEHEEHATITIPRGDWRVLRQVEATPWGLRRVAD